MIAIRFDGPPGPTSGHFIEVERDGAGISFGEWRRDEDSGDWLLELPEIALLVEGIKKLKSILSPEGDYAISRSDREKMGWGDMLFVGEIILKIDESLTKLG